MAARTDRLLDAVVVLLATWTVVYHAALLVDLSSDVALGIEVVLLVGVSVVRARRTSRPEPRNRPRDGGFEARPWTAPHLNHRVVLVAAVVAAVAMALDLPWVLVWVSWLVAGVAGVLAARRPGTEPTDDGTVPPGRREGWFAVACALGAAAFSTVTLRPNPDDLYYVNLSQWVAEHGHFPVRDTIFADLTYPMSNWPPLASYDGLTGAIAHVLGLRAGDVE
jgi:hypothetical protein